jgi:hypothetical protein
MRVNGQRTASRWKAGLVRMLSRQARQRSRQPAGTAVADDRWW